MPATNSTTVLWAPYNIRAVMADWRIMDLGNTPLSFEMARNVLTDPDNASKIYVEVPYINPTGGKAYLFQSQPPLCKLHAKFDPYKFMYLGKGFNKEFAVMKRYYHLKHKRTDLNKQLYNFQRHIYCLAIDECTANTSNLYLVHYFGNDYLLEDAVYRKGAPTIGETEAMPEIPGRLPELSYDDSTLEAQNSTMSDDEDSFPSLLGNYKSFPGILGNDRLDIVGDASPSQEYIPSAPIVSSARKRKSCTPTFRPSIKPTAEKRMVVSVETGKPPTAELDTGDYLFAMNMAARLQQLPDEIKARVKFQIATVFYEAEMKALNCPVND